MTKDQARFEDELRRREAEIAELHRVARLGSWRWSIADDRVEWSDVMYELAGIPRGTPIDFARYNALLHPDDADYVRETITTAMQSAQGYHMEHRLIRPDGEICWLRSRGDVVLGADGAVTGLIGTAQEVTDLIERKIAESENRRIRFLADASAELAASLDYQTTLRNVARLAVPAVSDWCAVDIVMDDGSLQRLALHHSDPAKVELAWSMAREYPDNPDNEYGVHHVIRTGQSTYVEDIPPELLRGVAIDQRHFELLDGLGLRSYIIAPLIARGRTLGAITVVYSESDRGYTADDVRLIEDLARRAATAIDNATLVRDLRAAQERLEQQATELEMQAVEMEAQAVEMETQAEELQLRTEELAARVADETSMRHAIEAASRAKSDFLAVMSHELRTPLNAMIGYSDLLLEGIPEALPEADRPSVQRIRLSARHLLELIDDILTFSRLEAGRESVRTESIALQSIADEVCAIAEPLALQKKVQFICDIEPGAEMLTDARKLRQILLNLVGNAIKFTENGTVTLVVRQSDTHATIKVTDTGSGIPAEELEHIFEAFYQVERDRSKRSHGTGLGLAVSRRFAELLGGTIQVESVEGAGSQFTLTLPMRPPAPESVLIA